MNDNKNMEKEKKLSKLKAKNVDEKLSSYIIPDTRDKNPTPTSNGSEVGVDDPALRLATVARATADGTAATFGTRNGVSVDLSDGDDLELVVYNFGTPSGEVLLKEAATVGKFQRDSTYRMNPVQ